MIIENYAVIIDFLLRNITINYTGNRNKTRDVFGSLI